MRPRPWDRPCSRKDLKAQEAVDAELVYLHMLFNQIVSTFGDPRLSGLGARPKSSRSSSPCQPAKIDAATLTGEHNLK